MSKFRKAAEPRAAIPEAEAPVVHERARPASLEDVAPPPEDLAADGRKDRPVTQVEVAHYTAKNWGGRHENEDRVVARRDTTAAGLDFAQVGVLDGHDTEQASDMVSRALPGLISRLLKAGRGVVEAYTQAMAELEEGLKKLHSTAGTCVCSCTIAGRHVWCSNLGDCRAVLLRLQVPESSGGAPGSAGEGRASSSKPRGPQVTSLYWLSRDQKASLPEERRRIEQAGGHVCDGRVEGLEPSRTLGDFDVKCQVRRGVISIVPEVRRCDLGDGAMPFQAVLVCGTDGIWDVISGQDVCNILLARKDLLQLQQSMASGSAGSVQPLADLAEDLVHYSVAKGSRDDCTAICALISVPPDPSPSAPPSSGGTGTRGLGTVGLPRVAGSGGRRPSREPAADPRLPPRGGR